VSDLRVSADGPVRTLVLDRPDRHNALDAALLRDLAAAVADVREDPACRAVVLTGTGGRAFSAGADLDELAGLPAHRAYELLGNGQRVLRAVETCGVPVIAAVDGVALGGGFELALACHVIVGSTRASFALPEAGLGLIPGYGGTQRLARLLGRQRAAFLMLTGRRLRADEAYAAGLLALPPVPPGDLAHAASDLAAEVSGRSPRSVRAILEALDRGTDAPLETGLALEHALAALATASPDAQEGVAAFRERRTPAFPDGPEPAHGGNS